MRRIHGAASAARRATVCATAALLLAACGGGGGGEVPDTAETVIGERLFRETRFAEFFASQVGTAGVNGSHAFGDPSLDVTETTTGPLAGAYAGATMNCAACHLVDEQAGVHGGGLRTYGDFARRSPIPLRDDGRTTTPRNSPPLVGSARERASDALFHFDGEFATLEDLVAATLTGRNYGWLPTERDAAIAHVVRVLREDDGTDPNAEDHGGRSYALLFRAPGNVLPAEMLLLPEFRLDFATATDAEVFAAAVRVIAQYVRELEFAREPVSGRFTGSPYDRFLTKNALPEQPDPGEAPIDYARRLRGLLDALPAPRTIGPSDGRFALHAHAFRFAAEEIAGLRIFLREPSALPATPGEVAAGGVGSCVRCHVPPDFTDVRFHGVGVAQEEYDAIHGTGAFLALSVPDLATRAGAFDAWLPPTAAHPLATGPFLDVPDVGAPGRTDLGLWNVYANPDAPGPQAALRALLLAQFSLPDATPDAVLLDRSIGLFKTPSLRDLADSAPYFHNGRRDTVEDVLAHYLAASAAARAGSLRNPSPLLSGIALREEDLPALRAFLRALDEDYE